MGLVCAWMGAVQRDRALLPNRLSPSGAFVWSIRRPVTPRRLRCTALSCPAPSGPPRRTEAGEGEGPQPRPLGRLGSSGALRMRRAACLCGREARPRARDGRVTGRVAAVQALPACPPRLALLRKWQPQACDSASGTQPHAAGRRHGLRARACPGHLPSQLPEAPLGSPGGGSSAGDPAGLRGRRFRREPGLPCS